jgi:aldehyde:ferredoxin oxidoreductase
MKGYTEKVIRVDLTNKIIKIEKLNMDYAKEYIGGRGLGTKYLYEEVDPQIDPLSPENKVDVVDTTGAGDTFCGALAAALVRGDSIEGAVIFANKAASFTVTRLGAQSGMPELADLL